MAVADLNGDTYPDMAVVNYSSGTVSVLLGDGSGGFAAATAFPTGTDPYAVAVADLNGDTYPDLAVTNYLSGTVSVLLGDGSGGFGAKADFATGDGPYSVAVGDLNGDTYPDLAVANYGSGSVSVLLGDGAGGFGAKADFATGDAPASVAVVDLNADTYLDLAVANFDSNSVSVLLGDGAGGFGAKTDFATGDGPYSMAVGDLNGDTYPDLATSGWYSDTVSVLLGDGTGAFGPKTDFTTGASPIGVAVGDLNGDTYPDLAVANYGSGSVSVLLGNGTGTLGAKTDFTTGPTPRMVAVGDLNGDTYPDLAVTNYYATPTVSVLLNTTDKGAITVTPNAGLVDGQSVAVDGFSWVPAHTIGFCEAAVVQPPGSSNCDGGSYTPVTADGDGNFSVSLVIKRRIDVPSLGRVVDCADPTTPCVIGAADTSNVPGTAVTVPLHLAGAPGPPTIGTVLGGDSQATVSWTVPPSDGGSPITGYVVTPYIGDAPQSPVPFNSTATTETVTELTNGTTYQFRVQAINAVGTGPYSALSETVTPGTPGPPTIGTATAASGRATVSWTAPSFDGGSPVIGYTVTPYVSTWTGLPRTFNSTATTQTITGLTNGWPYRFRVQAINNIGTGTYSAASNRVTPTGPGAPGPPTIGTVAAGDGQATVSWTAPASDGGSPITGYVVTPYIGDAPQSPVPFNSTATTETVTELTNGTTYQFRVQAINAVGTGPYSALSETVTPGTPGPPTIGTATAASGRATVSWTAPAFDGGSPVIGYTVTPYVSTWTGLPRTFNSTATTQTITGLTNGWPYRFRVQAINNIGTGTYSAETNRVTPTA